MKFTKRLRTTAWVLTGAALAAACGGGEPDSAAPDEAAGPASAAADRVVVYSARAEHLIKPIFDRYTEETGVEVAYTTDKEQPLIQRLLAEGENTDADMLLTVDAGNLWYAAEQGVLRPVESQVLEQNVPDHLQDPQNRWFALSVRARTIVYSTERVDPQSLAGYADLADDEWQGRLCLRTSKKVYNQSLVAMLIARYGEERTEEIVRGWVDNLAADVFSNDTKLMEAILAGQCDVGVVNSYYFGRLQKERGTDLAMALHWPSGETGGVHINVSGGGVTKHAPRAAAAVALLEWLSSPAAQEMFAGLNLEFPANPAVSADPLVAAWGEFEASDMPVARAGELQTAAVKLMDRAGYR
ncbi:extracellular solute-binding protein [Lentisalinibacter sediminis]|uniref:extracellular solute-binding protein n=1 Tax=Lentisalinibacter sediminis TaxID=2992237 RepID=UPI003865ADB0